MQAAAVRAKACSCSWKSAAEVRQLQSQRLRLGQRRRRKAAGAGSRAQEQGEAGTIVGGGPRSLALEHTLLGVRPPQHTPRCLLWSFFQQHARIRYPRRDLSACCGGAQVLEVRWVGLGAALRLMGLHAPFLDDWQRSELRRCGLSQRQVPTSTVELLQRLQARRARAGTPARFRRARGAAARRGGIGRLGSIRSNHVQGQLLSVLHEVKGEIRLRGVVLLIR
eukprot:6179983-Pleurochrysis_carterae.AAC.1